MKLALMPETLSVCRLDSQNEIPSWAISSSLFSISKIGNELSIVCLESRVPDGVKSERGWRCIKVVGTLEFSMVGVLHSLTAPLAQAGISIFAISTFDTDYLLVKKENLASAIATLEKAGHLFDALSDLLN